MEFSKMHGLGNDFIILEDKNIENQNDYSKLAVKLCDRHLGIGADGIIIVQKSDKADIRMRIINSDGSEANMCGNGIRCFAKYVYDNSIVTKEKFDVETFSGIIKPELIIEDNKVTSIKVNMGSPVLVSKDIPVTGVERHIVSEKLDVDGETIYITSMLMGVPHTVVFVDKLEENKMRELGPKIEKNQLFPKNTNVNFVSIINDHEIQIQTWERGAVLTNACGTGACASVVASVLNNKTRRKATVHLKHGDLFIEWDSENNVYMTGPADDVCCGVV